MQTNRPPELYQYLPIYCKLAIERLDSDNSLRNSNTLDYFIDSYAKTYGQECDEYHRESTHYRAEKRFYDYVS